MLLLIKSIFPVLIYSLSCLHPVHVSIINMEYFNEEQKIEYSIKVFKDDFQLLFFHLNEKNIDFNKSEEIDKNLQLIKSYFNKNLQISVNKKLIQQNYQKYTITDDAVWFFFDSSIKYEIISVKLINTVLLDLYFDQKNLLIFKAKDFENGYRFDIKNKEHLIEF